MSIKENHIFTRGYATREYIAFYDHSWNKFLSYTNIQQISSISLDIVYHHFTGKAIHKFKIPRPNKNFIILSYIAYNLKITN